MITGLEAGAAIAAARNVRDLVSGMKESSEKRKVSAAIEDMQDKVIDLQGILMMAKQSLALADERATQAEKKCMALENWQAEAARYALTEICAGVVAYAPKPGMEAGEPLHYLCAACFSKHVKGFLQYEDGGPVSHLVGDSLHCSSCSLRVQIEAGSFPPKSKRR